MAYYLVIFNNLNLLGLALSPEKTILVYFNKKGIALDVCSIKAENCILRSSPMVKFLGIHFDYQLKCTQHIESIRHTCFKKLNIFKFICGIRWEADPLTLIVLFKSLIRSIIEYNCFTYFPTLEQRMLRIERFQFAAPRIALGYKISTLTNILLGESKCPLLQDRAKFLCKKFVIKSMLTRSNVMYNTMNRLKFFDLVKMCE